MDHPQSSCLLFLFLPPLPLPALQPLHFHTQNNAVSPPTLLSPSAAFLPVIHPPGKVLRLHSWPELLPPALHVHLLHLELQEGLPHSCI